MKKKKKKSPFRATKREREEMGLVLKERSCKGKEERKKDKEMKKKRQIYLYVP